MYINCVRVEEIGAEGEFEARIYTLYSTGQTQARCRAARKPGYVFTRVNLQVARSLESVEWHDYNYVYVHSRG